MATRKSKVRTQKIAAFLWFDTQALEAAKFYVSVFKTGSRVVDVFRAGPGKNAPVVSVTFTLHGQTFHALNGGPRFPFSEAISLMVDCKDQREVDALWKKLTQNGGAESMCGWLKDKYGLSWQIIPRRLMALLQDKDPARAQRAAQAMLEMRKIDVPTLERAAKGP